MTLSCPDLRALPRERSLVLHDTATGRSWDLRSSGAIPVSLGADGRRQLTLRCEALTDRLRVRVTESAWMRGEARIHGTLSRPADLLLEVENAAGRIVRRRSAGPRTAGPFELTWDGRDDRGTTLPSGRYALRLTATADDGQCATCRVEVTR